MPLALAACLVSGFTAGPSRAVGGASGSASEYEIKAAYLYYFATFVDWPPESLARGDGTFVIGILGDDPFGPVLEATVRGKTVRNCRIVVRRFAKARDALDSHILFISSSEQIHLPQILGVLGGERVLTVGDADRFAERGGQIGLRMDGRKVRFEINVAAADRAGLKISSQLLKLGTLAQARSVPGD